MNKEKEKVKRQQEVDVKLAWVQKTTFNTGQSN
jgi:hypothetical protein